MNSRTLLLSIVLDFMAIFAEASGVAMPAGAALDSVSALADLTDPERAVPIRTETVFLGTGGYALRQGEWVFLPKQGSCGMTVQSPPGAPWGLPYARMGVTNSDITAQGKVKADAPPVQLYRLSNDPRQQVNLAAQGVSGFSLWVLHQAYYAPVGGHALMMSFGLWDFKAAPGVVHPVYHAMANFTRNTATGDAVTPVAVDGEGVRACIVGQTLFWVNLRTTPVVFNLKGASLSENCTYSQKTLSGEEECSTIETIQGDVCELAPRSFGRMKLKAL